MSSCLPHLQFFTKSLPDGSNERRTCTHARACAHTRTHTKTPKHLNTKITFTKSAERRVQGCDGADRLPVNTDKSHGSQRDLNAVLYLSFFFSFCPMKDNADGCVLHPSLIGGYRSLGAVISPLGWWGGGRVKARRRPYPSRRL